MARNEGGFHFLGREGHPHHSKGFWAKKHNIIPAKEL